MLPQPARRNVRGAGSLLAVLAGLSVTLSSLSCDKVPLLAPTGSVITLFATAATVPSNGSMEIVATVIEQGTASTDDAPGERHDTAAARPRHPHRAPALPCTTARWLPLRRRSGGLSRARRAPTTVRSACGSTPMARAGPRSSPRSPVARPGSSRTSGLGPPAVERLRLFASPQNLPSTGGVADVQARPEDASGNVLPGVTVTFSSDFGSLSSTTAVTDASGVATTRLTTSRQSIVTARAGGQEATLTIGLAERTGIALTPPSTPPNAGQPTSYRCGRHRNRKRPGCHRRFRRRHHELRWAVLLVPRTSATRT